MKKMFVLVSCFAVVLIMSKVSVAQQAAFAEPCPCPLAASPMAMPAMALPFIHPGLSIKPRDVRRATRLDARIAMRQARFEVRHAMPEVQGFPFMPAFVDAAPMVATMPAEFSPEVVPFGYSPGPIAQTGRINHSVQRVSANNTPVINFLSIVRGGARQSGVPFQHQIYPFPMQ